MAAEVYVCPILFLKENGEPLKFYLHENTNKNLLNIIEKGGGYVCKRLDANSKEIIKLASPSLKEDNKGFVSTKFINDSVKKEVAQDIAKYKLDRKFQPRFTHLVQFTSTLESDTNTHAKKTKRKKYSFNDDMRILQYIKQHATAEMPVGGNVLWKQMEQHKITNHSWQSMQKHFQLFLRGKMDLRTKDLQAKALLTMNRIGKAQGRSTSSRKKSPLKLVSSPKRKNKPAKLAGEDDNDESDSHDIESDGDISNDDSAALRVRLRKRKHNSTGISVQKGEKEKISNTVDSDDSTGIERRKVGKKKTASEDDSDNSVDNVVHKARKTKRPIVDDSDEYSDIARRKPRKNRSFSLDASDKSTTDDFDNQLMEIAKENTSKVGYNDNDCIDSTDDDSEQTNDDDADNDSTKNPDNDVDGGDDDDADNNSANKPDFNGDDDTNDDSDDEQGEFEDPLLQTVANQFGKLTKIMELTCSQDKTVAQTLHCLYVTSGSRKDYKSYITRKGSNEKPTAWSKEEDDIIIDDDVDDETKLQAKIDLLKERGRGAVMQRKRFLKS